MINGHYILWRTVSHAAPVEFFYVVAIAAILFVSAEIIDRTVKFIKKKRKVKEEINTRT